jgi:hypothetical protein
VKPIATTPSARTAIQARVLTWATVRAVPAEIAQWRKQPNPQFAAPVAPLTPSQLKNAEEQSIAALWAVSESLVGLETGSVDFSRWGAVAAPCYCGRYANVMQLERFKAEGAWGISPHMIPQHSLHAVSGTISQTLKMHGPNFGVGNGIDSASDGWIAAATLLSENIVPGLWLLLTGHVGEYLPGGSVHEEQHPPVEAVALALVPGSSATSGLQVRIGAEEAPSAFLDAMPEFALGALIDELRRTDTPPAAMWRLPGVGWIEVEMR